jgi:flagellar assembly protein FliH
MSEQRSTRWELPAMRGPVLAARGNGKRPGDLQEEDQLAWQAGFEAGQARGLKSGLDAAAVQIAAQQAVLEQSIASVQRILEALATPLRDLDQATEAELLRLTLSIGKQLARRELTADPSQVIAIIRDTVALLPTSARHVRVHLHPLDAVVVRAQLSAPGQEPAWTIVEDPVASRGGCRVSTDHAQIDARIESRVAALLAELCGDGREL